MSKRTVKRPVIKTDLKAIDKNSDSRRGVKETKKVGTRLNPSTNESRPIDKNSSLAVFPLKFIEVPLDCFRRGSSGEIQHEPTRKQIEDILTDYKFHSFNASFNRGQIIICFEKK